MATLKKMVNAALSVLDSAVSILELLARLTQGVHDSLAKILDDLKME